MTEMHPERPIEAVEIASDTGFVLPRVPAAYVVRSEVTPYPEADPIVMEVGQLDQAEVLATSVRSLIVAADEQLVAAGIASMLEATPNSRRSPLRGIGRIVAKNFSATEPPQSRRLAQTVPLYDPLSASLTLIEAVRWTEGSGQGQPGLVVADVSRGAVPRNRLGLKGQLIEIDPITGTIIRKTVQPSDIGPAVDSERPADPANLAHFSSIIGRSHTLASEVFKATRAYNVTTTDDVRRIVGIEWQPPEPPDRSWQ